MEIEVGEYIRTESGIIEKIKTFYEQTNIFKDEKGKLQKWLGETVFGDPYCEEILKHSKNIIDLVEEDDIVILEYYVRKYGQRITRKFEVGIVYGKIYFDNRHCSFWYDLENKKWGNGKGFNPKIKSILTKELFNENSYKL